MYIDYILYGVYLKENINTHTGWQQQNIVGYRKILLSLYIQYKNIALYIMYD